MEGKNYDVDHRLHVEEELLGALIALAANKEIQLAVKKHNVIASDFYLKIHREIFQATYDVMNSGNEPNPSAVVQYRNQEYRNNNSKEFRFAIMNIIQKALCTASSFEQNLFILKQYVIMDFWNDIAHNMLYGNWNGRDVLVVGDNAIAEYNSLYKRLTSNLVHMDEDSYASEIAGKVKRHLKGLSTGVSTCIPIVDQFTNGYSPGEVIVLAGRPGQFKTSYALISGWNTSKRGNPVLFFSLEMPKNQLKSKIISLETGIPYKDIKSGNLTSEELQDVIRVDKYIDSSNFYILDKVKTIEDMVEQTEYYVQKFGVKLMMMDYIQRTKTRDKMDMRIMITVITRELKSIAKDNYIPVLALSQLSRSVENRDNKRPRLSDLKESSSIEEDADIVQFLFRQAYYDQQAGQVPAFSELFATELIFAKGRDLGTTMLKLFINPIDMTINSYNFNGDY